jgi:hypothetical protein
LQATLRDIQLHLNHQADRFLGPAGRTSGEGVLA